MIFREVRIKVTPNASATKIVKKEENRFDIFVREKPENNNVNRRVLELLAVEYGVEVQKCRIVSGHHARSKRVRIYSSL